MVQYPPRQGLDDAGLFGQRDEDIRRDHAAFRVLPAGQGFHAAQPGPAHDDLGLVMQNHFAVLDRAPEIGGERQLQEALRVVLAGIYGIAAVISLRRVHRDIGATEKRCRIGAVGGEERNPDADTDGEIVAVHGNRRGQRLDNPLSRVDGAGQGGAGRLQLGEFIAAEASQGIGFSPPLAEPGGHGLQQLVARRAAQGPVDIAESIEVHDQQRHLAVVALGHRDRLLQPVQKQRSVGQPRQIVVQRLMGKLDLRIDRVALGAVQAHRLPEAPHQLPSDGFVLRETVLGTDAQHLGHGLVAMGLADHDDGRGDTLIPKLPKNPNPAAVGQVGVDHGAVVIVVAQVLDGRWAAFGMVDFERELRVGE